MDQTRSQTLDRRILPVALTLGVAGDLLFRNGVPALSLFVAVTLLVGAAIYLKGAVNSARSVPDGWMLGAIVCASAFALLDGFVLALDAVALGALIAGPTLLRYGAARTLPLFAFFKAIGFTMARTATGPFEIWGALLRGDRSAPTDDTRRIKPIIVGLLLAVPVMLVFGSLFAEADPAFHAVAVRFVSWDLSTIIQDLVLFTAGTVGAAGALRAWFDTDAVIAEPRARNENARPAIDPLALNIALGAMTLIFLSYVGLQFRYLFGGAEVVQSVTGLTVAEYARHGFFQVVQATALVIPVLLVVDDLARSATGAERARLRFLSRVQFLLTLIVLASAAARMWLYVDNFGWTQDRLLSSVVMLWLALVLVWFRATVLAEKRALFAFGAVVAGFGCLALLNLTVPDGFIMRENVRNAVSGKRPLDVTYAVRNTSANGIAVLIEHLSELPPATRDEVVTLLQKRKVHEEMMTGRSFNLARWRAAEALKTLPAAAVAP